MGGEEEAKISSERMGRRYLIKRRKRTRDSGKETESKMDGSGKSSVRDLIVKEKRKEEPLL